MQKRYIDNIPRKSGQFNVKLTVLKRWKNLPSLTPLKGQAVGVGHAGRARMTGSVIKNAFLGRTKASAPHINNCSIFIASVTLSSRGRWGKLSQVLLR